MGQPRVAPLLVIDLGKMLIPICSSPSSALSFEEVWYTNFRVPPIKLPPINLKLPLQLRWQSVSLRPDRRSTLSSRKSTGRRLGSSEIEAKNSWKWRPQTDSQNFAVVDFEDWNPIRKGF